MRTASGGRIHQYPVYSWKKAAGALFRAYMAWDLQQDLGVRMQQYGPNAEFTRIAGDAGRSEGLLVEAAQGHRRDELASSVSRLWATHPAWPGVNKLTREGKSHDNDPEVRHRRWQEEVETILASSARA